MKTNLEGQRSLDNVSTFIELLTALPAAGAPNLFNPWRDFDQDSDLCEDSPLVRRDHLRRYLDARKGVAKVLLVAEAPGYCGGKFSGLAMTSERDLLNADGLIENRFFDGPKRRTSKPSPALKNSAGMLERTASIVWASMLQGGFSPMEFVLWNIHAYHPHLPGNRLTNRAPTRSEVEAALPVLRAFLAIFPAVPIVAIGQVCQRTLATLGIDAKPARHPSYGGAPDFRAAIKTLRAEF